VTLIIL